MPVLVNGEAIIFALRTWYFEDRMNFDFTLNLYEWVSILVKLTVKTVYYASDVGKSWLVVRVTCVISV